MDRLLIAYETSMRRLREATAARLTNHWDDLGAWDLPQAETFAAAAGPVVAAAQTQAVALTDAYLSLRLEEPAVGLDPALLTGPPLRAGTDPDVVYQRPFVQLWKGLADGGEWLALAQQSRHRVAMTARTDIQLASRAAAAQRFEQASERVVGYRRVLTGAENCGLCVVASTQRYRRGDLAPIHPGCDCTWMEIRSDRDLGQVINRERLDGFYDQVGSGSIPREQLRQMRVDDDGVVQLPEVTSFDHGELGPTLIDAHHEPTIM